MSFLLTFFATLVLAIITAMLHASGVIPLIIILLTEFSIIMFLVFAGFFQRKERISLKDIYQGLQKGSGERKQRLVPKRTLWLIAYIIGALFVGSLLLFSAWITYEKYLVTERGDDLFTAILILSTVILLIVIGLPLFLRAGTNTFTLDAMGISIRSLFHEKTYRFLNDHIRLLRIAFSRDPEHKIVELGVMLRDGSEKEFDISPAFYSGKEMLAFFLSLKEMFQDRCTITIGPEWNQKNTQRGFSLKKDHETREHSQ